MHWFGDGMCGWFFMMVLVAFIIVVVVGFLRWFVTRHRPPVSTEEDAHDILKKRYARGDISQTIPAAMRYLSIG